MYYELVGLLLVLVSINLTGVKPQLRFKYVLFSVLLGSQFAVGSTCLDSFYRTPKVNKSKNDYPYRKFKSALPGKPRISLSRFEGFESYYHRFSINYQSATSAFAIKDNPMQSLRHGFGKDENFLNELQQFPLSKMTETGYLSADEARMFNRLGASLEPGQVSFFEVTRAATRQQWADYPRELLGPRWDNLNFHRDDSATGLASIRTATFWSIAGQTLDYATKSIRKLALPWEKEDARKDQSLDRQKYKHVWEWGRAAQDIAEEIPPLYAGNSALNYIDLIISGGRLADAYVMFHSFDRVNTRYYLSEHPASTYPPHEKNENDMLFLVPLKEMMRKYPPRNFSQHVKSLIEISENKLSDAQAIEILVDMRILRWDELDGNRQNGPVIVNDVSPVRLFAMQIRLLELGISKEQMIKLMDYLVAISPTLHTSNTQNKYKYAADSILTSFIYEAHKAIEISNLDPTVAARDPNYVMATLINTYVFYVNRLSKLIQSTYGVPSLRAKQEALQLIIGQDIKFGLTSAEPEIQKQIAKLKPTRLISQPKTESDFMIDEDTKKMKPYIIRDSQISIFSIPQIVEWAQKNPDFMSKADYEINSGFWRQQYFRSQIDIL